MASTILKKITAEAKRIRKKHPAMAWVNAVKQAGKKFRGKKAAPKKKRAVKKKALSRSAKVRKYSAAKYAKKKYTPAHRIAGIDRAVVSKGAIRSHYKVQLGNQLLNRELATTKTKKKQISKKIAETKRALTFLS